MHAINRIPTLIIKTQIKRDGERYTMVTLIKMKLRIVTLILKKISEQGDYQGQREA